MLRAITVLIFSALLAGCGFHLRGGGLQGADVPLTYLQGGSPNAGVSAELSRLEQFTNDAAKAQVVLNILSENFDRRVLSVGSDAKVSEYEVRYTVSFSATDKAGKEIIAPQTIALKRDYRFDETRVLAADAEEATLRRDMARDAAQRIIRRLEVMK
ncbi:MAG: LPS assembly lipoprotein LptE [Pseudomonadota bacterium]